MAELFQNDFFYSIDWAIYELFDKIFNVGDNLVADSIWTFITHLGDDGIFWIALGICLLIPKKTRKWGVCLFMGLAVSSLFNNIILKDLFERPRPFWNDDTTPIIKDGVVVPWKGSFSWPDGMDYVFPYLIEPSNSWSFPSGHSATSVGSGFAFMLGCSKKKWGVPVFILGILVALSRIYVRIHYPTDVIAGIIIGLISGAVAYYLVKAGIKFAKKRFGEEKVAKILGE